MDSTTEIKQQLAPCPRCKKPVQWHELSPYRPFCSQRCQLLDLGDWAGEKFTLPISGNSDSDSDIW